MRTYLKQSFLKVWSLDQPHQHPLDSGQKHKAPGSTQTSWIRNSERDSPLCLPNSPPDADTHWSFQIADLKSENRYILVRGVPHSLINLTLDSTLQGKMGSVPSAQAPEVLGKPHKQASLEKQGDVAELLSTTFPRTEQMWEHTTCWFLANIFWAPAMCQAFTRWNYLA